MTTMTTVADRACSGAPASPAEALEILRSTDDQLLDLIAAAGRVRRHFFGNSVKVNYLVNLKSGLCPEDCGYCSQRLGSDTEILKYSWLPGDEARRQAEFGLAGGASRVCLVASGRGPSNRDVERVATMTEDIKANNPGVEVCACLGFLKDGQADRLRSAGVDAYNHNLNTAESNYPEICSTHTFADRVDTVEQARSAGLSPCSGLIVGMGETPEQVVEAITALRALGADSIPVNFLIPFEGTPLAGICELTPQHCLRILAAVRLMCPDSELRIAGGREMHLRTLQPLALHVANSLFLGDYLTSEGQDAEADLDMIVDGGFSIVGQDSAEGLREKVRTAKASHAAALSAVGDTDPSDTGTEPAPTLPCGKVGAVGVAGRGGDGVVVPTIRRRGAGTTVSPNA